MFSFVAGNKFAALFLLYVDSGNVSQLPLNIKRRYPTSNGRVIEPLVLSNFSASALSLSSVYIQTGCKILEAQHAFIAKVLKFDIVPTILQNRRTILSQPVSTYFILKMEMRWKWLWGDFILRQVDFEQKVRKSN